MTRVLLDACVLFPSVMREVLLGAARAHLLTPLWSKRILEEWRRAALRRDSAMGAVAETEILLLKARWPKAMVTISDELPTQLSLPDPNDTHVLAAAITGQADALVTANLRDFPTRVLARHGILRRDPDGLLLELAHSHSEQMLDVAQKICTVASEMQGQPQDLRRMLRKTGLPRLGKHLQSLIT